MRILIISQVFWPDTASVSQHLTDIAEDLVSKGNTVNVLSSRYSYEYPKVHYIPIEVYKNIRIKRLWQTGFGKSSKLGRIFDFLTFNFSSLIKLLLMKRGEYDLFIGTTVPPLISFMGVFFTRIKKARFCFWAMDLQPELAIVAGYIKENSLTAKLLLLIGDYIIKRSDLIIALDKYMVNHIIKRGGNPNKIKVVPVWPVVRDIYWGPRLENPFRMQTNFGDKIIIMYSGNLSVVHPLDTLLNASLILKNDQRFLFVFIGGGVRKKEVLKFKSDRELDNIIILPYQDRDQIHLSLGAADIHVVIHGNGCTGYTHPNKIYGAMFIGKPILYIGPIPSHITDILENCPGNIIVQHGETERVIEELILFSNMEYERWKEIGMRNMEFAHDNFRSSKLINNLISELENLC
jgi:glycosyltransferase involved in cell wall biosynthesis